MSAHVFVADIRLEGGDEVELVQTQTIHLESIEVPRELDLNQRSQKV